MTASNQWWCCGGGTEIGHAPWCKNKGLHTKEEFTRMTGKFIEDRDERTVAARVDRLRDRVRKVANPETKSALMGLLDLLKDELPETGKSQQ